MTKTIYTSDRYTVTERAEGAEIARTADGATRLVAGAEVGDYLTEVAELGPDASRVERFSDVLLSHYFKS